MTVLAELKGSIEPGIVAPLLRSLYLAAANGTLVLAHGADDRVEILVAGGRLISAQTGLPGANLADLLIQVGHIGARDAAAAAEIATLRGESFVATLQRTKLISNEALQQGVSLQMREILLRVLPWDGGAYAFVPLAEGPKNGSVEGLDPRSILLDAAWSLAGDSLALTLLGDLRRPLRLTQEKRLSALDLSLSPVDAFLLSRVDGKTKASELLKLAPEDNAHSLLGLVLAGVVEFVHEPAPPSPTEEVRRANIVKLAGRMHLSDPFEILDVDRHATTIEIRAAYMSLLSAADPARTADPELKPTFQAMVTRVESCYQEALRQRAETLSQPGSESLPKKPVATKKPTARVKVIRKVTLGEAKEPDPRPELSPDDALSAALKASDDGQHLEALNFFHSAISRMEGRKRRVAQLHRARLLSQTPNGDNLAEEDLRRITDEDPGNAEAWSLLGYVHEGRKSKSAALAAYSKALALSPRSTELRAAIERLGGNAKRAERGTKGDGSVLKRLFGR